MQSNQILVRTVRTVLNWCTILFLLKFVNVSSFKISSKVDLRLKGREHYASPHRERRKIWNKFNYLCSNNCSYFVSRSDCLNVRQQVFEEEQGRA